MKYKVKKKKDSTGVISLETFGAPAAIERLSLVWSEVFHVHGGLWHAHMRAVPAPKMFFDL